MLLQKGQGTSSAVTAAARSCATREVTQTFRHKAIQIVLSSHLVTKDTEASNPAKSKSEELLTELLALPAQLAFIGPISVN